MRIATALFSFALFLSPATPASAQGGVTPFANWDQGSWHVYRADDIDCWMVKLLPDGGHLGISVARSDRNFYLSLARAAWTGIGVGQSYYAHVHFGSIGRIFEARRIHGIDPPTVSMTAKTSRTDFPALLKARAITISTPDGRLFRSMLDPAALRSFSACAASLGGVASTADDD